MDEHVSAYVELLACTLAERGWLLATAESCTGGLIAAWLTEQAGSSRWFDRGYVSYSNRSKEDLLGVRADTLAAEGAVSEAVALEMASGALRNSRVQCALSVTGIAGPSGGTAAKPVGTVCFGWAWLSGQGQPIAEAETRFFSGDRERVRCQSASYALQGLLSRLRISG